MAVLPTEQPVIVAPSALQPHQPPAGALVPDSLEHPADARYHGHLLQSYREGAGAYGKALITLNGGLFYVSVKLIEIFKGPHSLLAWSLLVASWVCVSASLATALIALRDSPEAMLAAADQYPWNAVDWNDPNQRSKEEEKGRLSKRIMRCNSVCLYSFILAITTLVLFVVFCKRG
ncbi:hypothetical protein WME77_19190 [Sorangium sp. So ce764]|uniref:hypothetical protein n=1 Tax=Sorangium sp. So ce764 TaxID=3133320 RepID=UPI003F5E2079